MEKERTTQTLVFTSALKLPPPGLEDRPPFDLPWYATEDSIESWRTEGGRTGARQGREIRWLETVQADYTFSFVLKYGRSQRENNVSLITRFGSTEAHSSLDLRRLLFILSPSLSPVYSLTLASAVPAHGLSVRPALLPPKRGLK